MVGNTQPPLESLPRDMWIGHQDNDGSLRAIIIFDHPVVLQAIQQSAYHLGLMWALSQWFAANRWAGPGVNLEREATDGDLEAFLTEDIPIVIHHLNNFGLELRQAPFKLEIAFQLHFVSNHVKFDHVILQREGSLACLNYLPCSMNSQSMPSLRSSPSSGSWYWDMSGGW